MKNDIFSFKRFGLLFTKDIQENWKKYLMRILTIYGVLTIVFIFSSWDSHRNEYTSSYYIDLIRISVFFFLGFGCISASMMMDVIDNKTKRISYLMNPSSVFEKYILRWLIVTVGFIIFFFAAFYLADLTRFIFCSIKYPDLNVGFTHLTYLIDNSEYPMRHSLFDDVSVLTTAITVYFLMQSVFVLGTTFWPKGSFIKTFSASIIIVVLFVLVCRGVILLAFGDFNDFDWALSDTKLTKDKMRIINPMSVICMFFAIVNWVLAFFRFKEWEVVKRW